MSATLYMTEPTRPTALAETRSNLALGEAARYQLKAAVHHELIKRVDLDKLDAMQHDASGRQKLLITIGQLLGEQNTPLSSADRDVLAQEVVDEVFGLGPLEPLLHDPTVSDILVNTFNTVYVERRGVIEETDITFRDPAHLMHIIDKIVSAVGRRIDESSPMVDARLLDGSRVNIVIPPLAVGGPLLSIRRPAAGEGADAANAGLAGRRGQGQAEHCGVGRDRRGQDDAAECDVRLHLPGGADRHH
jgi:pilus assembly protein CpaF